MHNNKYNLLVESSDEIEILTENTSAGKQHIIEGIFAQAEKVNGNRRYYPRSVMESAINSYNTQSVMKNRAVGELNHPDYPMPNIRNAAIRITELKWEGNNVRGKAIVLDTPEGNIVKGLMEGGFSMGVSTRGLGSLKMVEGINHVQNDFQMTAIDCVDNPSGPDCYVNSITEGKRWMVNESTGVWIPVMDEKENVQVNEQIFLERLDSLLKSFKK